MMSQGEKVAAAVVGAVVLLGGIGIAYAAKSGTAATPGKAATGQAFIAGHRYAFTETTTTQFATAPTSAAAQASLDALAGPGVFRVASVSTQAVAGGQSVVVLADCTSSFTSTAPQLQSGATETAFGSTVVFTIADQGLTPGGGAVASTWTRQLVAIAPGSQVRVSIAPADLTTLATALGLRGESASAQWADILTSQPLLGLISQAGVQAWGPGQALPADWPADDTAAATEYHAQFTYGGATSAPIPAGFMVWTSPLANLGQPLGGGGGVILVPPGGGNILHGRPNQPQTITPANAGQTLSVRVSSEVDISLPIPQPGYFWYLAITPQGQQSVQPLPQSPIPGQAPIWSAIPSGAAGASATLTTLATAGAVTLQFAQFDPSLHPASPTAVFLVNLNVAGLPVLA